MNVEFHYYAIYALALEAGFDDRTAYVMASSSQEVDASTTPLSFDAPRGAVELPPTQNYVFWDEAVMRDAYLPFHFVPGDPAEAAKSRNDGAANPYAVTANGESAKELLVAALKDKDPYLIGVALHPFADTWAHQNFCGLLDRLNDLDGQRSALDLPPAGHLQALSKPDDPHGVWEDARLVPAQRRVVNVERFAAAARKIYRYMRVYLGKPFADDELVVARLESVWAKPSKDERVADYVIAYGLRPYEPRLWRREAGVPDEASPFSGIGGYDKLAWVKAGVRDLAGSAPTRVSVGQEFYSTDLFRWMEAAVEHRARAKSIFRRRGL